MKKNKYTKGNIDFGKLIIKDGIKQVNVYLSGVIIGKLICDKTDKIWLADDDLVKAGSELSGLSGSSGLADIKCKDLMQARGEFFRLYRNV